MNELLFFSGFIVVVLFILFLDLGIFDRKSHVIGFREAFIWTSVWVTLAIAFYVFLRFWGYMLHGIDSLESLKHIIEKHDHSINITGLTLSEAIRAYNNALSLEYITGYLIEYTLSIDNVFVILMIFYSFNVNEIHYKRVLFWGILGAIIFRFIFIFLSSTMIQHFSWTFYIFGAILLYSGVKMFIDRNKKETIDARNHPVVKFASKYFKVYPRYVGQNFFVRQDKVMYVTPLFIVLLIIEFSDIIFAIDSVPAIFSVTKDPYIVFFSNVFAILGLRSLFFFIVHVIKYFRFLKVGISFLLIFIGFKLIFHHWLKDIGFSTMHSLYIVLSVLLGSILFSIVFPEKKQA
ncbi:MAG: TerC/Alx family metal homeostasis membrane protein [Bacteroidales bacterium]|nr:TerC/Alx family metal homeostasis membrane protein [Bacteroidales bacterium]